MENEIGSNLVYLANRLTNLESVLLHLIESKILSNDEREEILSGKTSSSRNTTLLILLQKRDWDVVRNPFLEILTKTHNEHCAKKIEGNFQEVQQPVSGWTYETNSILGYGSFGVVISAKNTMDNQNFAIKIIPTKEFNISSVETAKLLRESRNQAILQHSNVVRYISSDTFSLSTEKIKEILLWESTAKKMEQQIQLLLMKYFEEAKLHGSMISGLFIKTEICGETLRQWLNNHVENEGSPDTNICKNIGQGIVDGLNYIHSISIIHRDLRPENIFFSKPNFVLPVKIGDFGLSQQIENYTTQTLTLEVGNHLYRAPETNLKHKAGSAKYSHAIDLYSCGLTLSEIFDPAPTKELPMKFNIIVYDKDTGNRIKEFIPSLNELILKLTDREPTNRFNRDANEKPLPMEFLKVSSEKDNVNVLTETLRRESESLETIEFTKLHQKAISQQQKGKSEQHMIIKGEKKKNSKVILQEDLSKVKQELRKLVKEKNISEIVKILSVTTIPKYLLSVDKDKIELTFTGETKKMDLRDCSLNLDSFKRISAEELTLYDVSFLRNGKKLEKVTANELVDINKINKLSLDSPKKKMSLDLRISLEYLYLRNIKVHNWKNAKWTVQKLELNGFTFTEKTKAKVKEIKIWHSPMVDLSCLPQTLEKLILYTPEEVLCTGRIKLPNLKCLELYDTSNNILSHFSSANLRHLYLWETSGEINLNFIPKSVSHIKILGSHPPVVVGVLKLEKLILTLFSANEVKEYLTHFQPKELVVQYSPKCPSNELLELLKNGIQSIVVMNVYYDSILSEHVDRESDYYLFEGETGKAITYKAFLELLNF